MLFSKKIDTKRDHHAELKAAIDAAINEALKNGVSPGSVQAALESWSATLNYRQHVLDTQRNTPVPRQYIADEHGVREVDYAAAARAEEKGIAAELKRQQAKYPADIRSGNNA
jgi:hypothetical protein